MQNKMKYLWLPGLLLLLWHLGCSPESPPGKQRSSPPTIYPDYTGITIPVNIAPLNFRVEGFTGRVEAEVTGRHGRLTVRGKNGEILFPLKKFRSLLRQHAGDSLAVRVITIDRGARTAYAPFFWKVSAHPIDPFLTYRLIEPGYEVWNKITLNQRDVTSFEEKVLADNNLLDGACMNCHVSNKKEPGSAFFHLRHANGGTVISQNGKLRKLDTRTDSTLSAGVYGNWHPSGRFIAFSANTIIPEFYAVHNQRMEVYDTESDLVILDVSRNEVFTSPLISSPAKLETFPGFSADGKRLFFCSADTVDLPARYADLKYGLYAISFDPETMTFGEKADTLFSAALHDKSVSEPKASPDGRYLLFTVMDYGTFPIWHPEARLFLLDLSTHRLDTLSAVNTHRYSNSYHSWSANSRWFVFASKRGSGLYGKPYFAHVDEQGRVEKPFLLPQKEPGFYDLFTRSFNIPELFETSNPYSYSDVEKIFPRPAEKVTFRSDQP